MSRSGYVDEGDADDNWSFIMWRQTVANAIKGKRGQAFLKEMLGALDGLPEKKLIARNLECNGAVCAIGAVGRSRGIDMKDIDPEDSEQVATAFKISNALTKEIVYMNDEGGRRETQEDRHVRMRQWVAAHLK